MKKGIKIAVSGKSGCGNTTVSKIVADRLNLCFINFTFRSLAMERGLELREVLELAAKDDSWDKEVDKRQVQLARNAQTGCVLGSRLSMWMLPEADLKVYLRASPETRVGRIVKREGGIIEEVAAFTADRDRQDRDRYLRIYNLDNDNYEFADCIIDVDDLDPSQIADIIIQKAQTKK